jgi:thioester reductase-like protein
MSDSFRLLTGFPGFLGTELMSLTLRRSSDSFACVVQPKFKGLAEERLSALEAKIPEIRSRVRLIEGDITEPGLGIREGTLPNNIVRVQHFAAVYDLNVKEAFARRINVEGTRRILDFCKTLPSLTRLDYVSTCYVSGRFEGTFFEGDLEKGQRFNNHYESTKHEAERLVRTAMNEGLPATVFRPAIVVGDSRTGVTQKFDGPYFVMQWLLRQGTHALLPRIGDPDRFTINLVPSDFVIEALSVLSEDPETLGKTFQLADPSPLSIRETVEVIAAACGKKLIEIPLPRWLAKSAIAWIPGLERWTGIPRSSLDYFVHPTQYDTTEATLALSRHGIRCPSFRDYAPTLVEYMKANPGVRNRALA